MNLMISPGFIFFCFFTTSQESTCPQNKMKPALKTKYNIRHGCQEGENEGEEGNSSNFRSLAAVAKTLIYCINSGLPRAYVQIK